MTTVPAGAGTVAFLPPDVEGSTKVLDRLGAECRAVLMRQRDLLARAVAVHGDVMVESEGNALFV
jgi:hypothetical protein